jgi:ABC-type phosphate transport system substrate-binding protein
MNSSINILKVISFGIILAISGAATSAITFNSQGTNLVGEVLTGNSQSVFPAGAPKPESLFGLLSARTNQWINATYAANSSGSGKDAIKNNTSPFAFSGVPLTQSEYTAILNDTGGQLHIAPIQGAALISSIAVVYNNPSLPNNINLTSAQIAKIFAGEITNWNQVNTRSPSLPIKVVINNGDSGSTFAFLNHLNAAGGLTGGRFFKVNELFSNSLNGGAYFPAITYYPQSNDQAVVDYVNANVGAIGYTSITNALQTSSVKIVKVNGFLPTTLNNFLDSRSLLIDQVITGINAKTGAVSYAPIIGIPTGKAGNIKLVNPASYAYPIGTYPIVAVSYVLSYTDNNKTLGGTPDDPARVGALNYTISTLYQPSYQSAITSPGFGFVHPSLAAPNQLK